MEVQESVNKLIKDCKRVLKVSKKPDKEEYVSYAKINVIGMIIIGVIGFIIVIIGYFIGL